MKRCPKDYMLLVALIARRSFKTLSCLYDLIYNSKERELNGEAGSEAFARF